MQQAPISELVETLGREGREWLRAEATRGRLQIEHAGKRAAVGAVLLVFFALGLQAMLTGVIRWLAPWLGPVVSPLVVGGTLVVVSGVAAAALLRRPPRSGTLPAPKELTDGLS
jgi:hypothetical protein